MVPQSSSETPNPSQLLSGSEQRMRQGAARAGPADPAEVITLSIYVRSKAGAQPPTMEYYVQNPPGHRQLISAAELADRYGAAPDDLKLVTDFAAASSLAVVTTDPARRLVQVRGTAAQLANAFGVELFQYTSPTETYRGYEGSLSVPANLAGVVVAVLGLDNRPMARRAGGIQPFTLPTVTPPQVAGGYNFPTPPNNAAGQTIAILEFSGPSPFRTCGFSQTDVDDFINDLNAAYDPASDPSAPVPLQSSEVIVVTLPGSSGNVLAGSATNVTQAASDIEVALDTQIVVSLAQGAQVLLYFAPMTEQGWVDALTAILSDERDPCALSISWGWTENEPLGNLLDWTDQTIALVSGSFSLAAHRGITVFVATGDDGSNAYIGDGKAHVAYPASDPWVTACGGTVLTISPKLKEQTWPATGGGISYLQGAFGPAIPAWQANLKLPPSANNDGQTGRGLPDVAGNAGIGYNVRVYGQQATHLTITSGPGAGTSLGPQGGTSAVAPLYAALVALLNAALGTTPDSRVGYLNPTLYPLGTSVFHDINDRVSNSVPIGNTGKSSPGYTSGPGWDACTGWGSIDGLKLLYALSAIMYGTAAATDLTAYWEGNSVALTWKIPAGHFASGFQLERYAGAYSEGAQPDEPPIQLPGEMAEYIYDDELPESPAAQYQYRLVTNNFFDFGNLLGYSPSSPAAILSNIVSTSSPPFQGASGTGPSHGTIMPTHPGG
jgi:kumamolisin